MKKIIPAIIAIALILVVLGVSFGAKVVERYSYSKEEFLLGNVYDNKPLNNYIFKNMNLNKSNPNECGECKLPGCIRCYAANLEQTGKLDICNFN